MRKIKLFISFIVFAQLMLCVGCLNGVLVWADNSVTQTPGIDVKVLENTKKQFVLGVDENELVSLYSEFGTLTTFNIEISGSTTLESLKKSTTGMVTDQNGIGQISKNQSESDYYADWFKIKIYLPKNAKYVNFLDNRGDILIDKPTMVEDTYLKNNMEYIKLNKAKTEVSLVSNTKNQEAYYFISFSDENKNVLERYFIHISYKIEIK